MKKKIDSIKTKPKKLLFFNKQKRKIRNNKVVKYIDNYFFNHF